MVDITTNFQHLFLDKSTSNHDDPVATSYTGFSNNLKICLHKSRSSLDAFLKIQQEQNEKSRQIQAEIVHSEHLKLESMMLVLKKIQVVRGLYVLSEEQVGDSSITKKRLSLKEKQTEIEKELATLRTENFQINQTTLALSQIAKVEREKAEQTLKSKEDIEDSKKTTINDLTYAILKYKKLGIDFVKGEGSALQCNFTQVDHNDPKRVFSFLLNVSEDDVYEVHNCNPELKATLIMKLVDDLNSSEIYSQFILGMRKAFKVSLRESLTTP